MRFHEPLERRLLGIRVSFITAMIVGGPSSQLVANPIIHQVGPVFGFASVNSGQADEVSWTQTSTFTNVAVNGQFENGHYVAFLTNQIGAGTTVANQIATSTFTVTGQPEFDGLFVTIFSGLTLGPGTYFLEVGTSDGTAGGWDITDHFLVPTVAAGVIGGSSKASGTPAGYLASFELRRPARESADIFGRLST